MNLSNGERKYLLGIVLTRCEYGWTRLKWIADFFGVRMPTVKDFLEALKEKKLINYPKRGAISLTKYGEKIANEELQRYKTVVDFLKDCLALEEDKAKESALKILFDLDELVSERMFVFMEMMKKCSASPKPVFIRKFESYVKEGKFKPCLTCPFTAEGGKQDDGK